MQAASEIPIFLAHLAGCTLFFQPMLFTFMIQSTRHMASSVSSQAEICLLRYLQIFMFTRGPEATMQFELLGGHARLPFRGGECRQVENALDFSAESVNRM
jgi:hypothetical protein